MNPQRPGIGWCDWTWNPITGCEHGCPWCYARAGYERFGRSFKPTLHADRLGEPARVKKPARIFLGSVTDFGSPGIDPAWLRQVVEATRAAPWHKYLVLTKAPERLPAWLFDEPWWFGVSVTCQEDLRRVDVLSERMRGTDAQGNIFASFEPLLGPVVLEWPQIDALNWLILGALTRYGRTPSPAEGGTEIAWLAELAWAAVEHERAVYVKENVRPIVRRWQARPASARSIPPSWLDLSVEKALHEDVGQLRREAPGVLVA